MFINRMKGVFSKHVRIMVLQTLVLSTINFGIKTWRSTGLTQLRRVQKIQNFAAKVALGGAKFDHATTYLKELKRLKVKEKYKYELVLSMFNFI